MADAGSQIVAHNLRDSGYTFYRESMLVLGQSRRYVQAHTCARTQKHPCTHPRTHADAYTPTSHKPKHAHTRAHAQKRARTRQRTPRCPALTSSASMEVDHPVVASVEPHACSRQLLFVLVCACARMCLHISPRLFQNWHALTIKGVPRISQVVRDGLAHGCGQMPGSST